MKGQIDDNADYLDKPIWMVPIGRNPSFVERNAVMSDLESKLLPMPDVVLTAMLCGLGGVGYPLIDVSVQQITDREHDESEDLFGLYNALNEGYEVVEHFEGSEGSDAGGDGEQG